MKQVTQNYRTGLLEVISLPDPQVSPSSLIVRTRYSLISAGTERTKIETANMNLVEKAFSRLDLVKVLVTNIKQEGIPFTLKKAFNKLDTPITLGYSCAGEVVTVGDKTSGYKPGDHVACIGEKYAAHAELNLVPDQLAVQIPAGVTDEEAAFCGVGAIALNAVGISQAAAGETVVVIGLGLIGQIVVQILKARGCKVVGVEIDRSKLELAKKYGADVIIDPLIDDAEAMVRAATAGAGADAVIIAAASRNNLPIDVAGRISRDKGRVILVGAMPIMLPRKEYYEKELIFMVARGFGADLYFKPERDRRYPFAYTAVTSRENVASFLALVADKKVHLRELVTHVFPLDNAPAAYDMIRQGTESYLGILYSYPATPTPNQPPVRAEQTVPAGRAARIGFIGAGSFAQGYILPQLRQHPSAVLEGVCTGSGMTAQSVARKFAFAYPAAGAEQILEDRNIDTVFIMTRHNLHARQIIAALKAGKRAFVEKPLCTNADELREIIAAYRACPHASVMVGFNRRFSPFLDETSHFYADRVAPLNMMYRVNAGFLPQSHWAQDSVEGGGRIVGEMCHFVDVFQFLAKSVPVRVSAVAAQPPADVSAADNVSAMITFADGSVGTLLYSSQGDPAASRERLETFADGSVAIVENYAAAHFTRCGTTRGMRRLSRDMGHNDEVKRYIDTIVAGGPPPIPFRDIVAATLTTFAIIESLKRGGEPVAVDVDSWL